MGETYVDAKTVLDSVKSSTWKYFKFRVSGGEVDKNFTFCRLCLDNRRLIDYQIPLIVIARQPISKVMSSSFVGMVGLSG